MCARGPKLVCCYLTQLSSAMRAAAILLAAGLFLAASAEPLKASLHGSSNGRSAHVVARNLDEDAPAAYAGPAVSASIYQGCLLDPVCCL